MRTPGINRTTFDLVMHEKYFKEGELLSADVGNIPLFVTKVYKLLGPVEFDFRL